MAMCATGERRNREYVYKSTLRTAYGLTPKMIDELGQPDEWCENPHYRQGPPASLYLIERVEAWVRKNQARLDKASEQRVRRSAAAKAVHERSRAERLLEAREWVNGFTIEIQQPLPATLLDDAFQVYPMFPYPEGITAKALHAYVRNTLTNFGSLRHRLRKHEFKRELYFLLRERVDSAIAAAVFDWRQLRLDQTRIGQAPFLPTWQHFFNRLMVVEVGDERRRFRLSTKVSRVGVMAGDCPVKVGSDGAASESGMMRQVQNELLALLRQIGWRGRKLLKSAMKYRAGVWRVDPVVARALLGTVPHYDSPYGPRLTDCLDFLTSGAASEVALFNRATVLDMEARSASE